MNDMVSYEEFLVKYIFMVWWVIYYYFVLIYYIWVWDYVLFVCRFNDF